MSEKNILVAVYGSLLSGLGNHGCMTRAEGEFVGKDTLPANYTMTSNGGFPYLYPEGTDPVEIEVYKVAQEGLEGPLDSLEGYSKHHPESSFYIRKEIETQYGTAWIYFHNASRASDNRTVVPNGDWKAYKTQQ